MLTDDQLAERLHYLGGTDLAALAGVSRWGTPYSVWADKRPDLAGTRERTTSPLMALGSMLEQVVADLAAEALGITFVHPRLRQSPWVEGMTTRAVACRHHRWEGANVDRFGMTPNADVVLECKWGEARRRWGDPVDTIGTDLWAMTPVRPPIVPEDYYVQVQHYLHVTGRPIAVMAVLLGYADFRLYRIAPDDGLQGDLVALGRQFWHDHVLPGVAPAVDGSAQAEALLRRLHPTDSGLQRPATPSEAEALATLRTVQEHLAETAKLEAKIKQTIMDSMGATTRIDAPGVSVTWRQNKPTVTTTTDWQAVIDDLTALVAPSRRAQVGGIVAARTATATKDGARPLRITYSDDEEA